MNDVRTALETERLAATLDRNDAGLRVGRHGELLPQVAAMASDHRLDERLAGQLMLAQFRCGRQADALETYRAMRERLVEELGADPGPALPRCTSRSSKAIPDIRLRRRAFRVPLDRVGACRGAPPVSSGVTTTSRGWPAPSEKVLW